MRKKFIALFMSVLMLITMFPVGLLANNGAKSDITGHWAEPYIKWCIEKGYFKGYPDGTFKPDALIKRNEYIKVMSNITGFMRKANISYTDVKSSDWYYDDLQNIVSLGILDGKGEFYPEKPMIRDEAFRILAGLYKLSGDESALARFHDYSDITSKKEIAELVKLNVVCGNTKGKINPNNNITRAEVCKILKVIIEKLGTDINMYHKLNDIDETDTQTSEENNDNKKVTTNNRRYRRNYDENNSNEREEEKPYKPNNPINPVDPVEPNKPNTGNNDKLDIPENEKTLEKLKELIKKHDDEVVNSDKFIFASEEVKAPYVEAIEKAEILVGVDNPSDSDVKDLINEIINTYNKLNGKKPEEKMTEEKAKDIIKEKAEAQKEKEDPLYLNSKLKNSKIIIDNIDSDYSMVTQDESKHITGKVITDKNIVRMGAYIVDVSKESNIESSVTIDNKNFTFDLNDFKVGSNKVNVYAVLEDGELVEKTFFIERFSKEIDIKEDVIYATDKAKQDSTDDIEGLYSADGGVELLAVRKGSSVANQIESGVKSIIINLGYYEVKHIEKELTLEEALKLTNNKVNSDSNLLYYVVKNGNLGDLASGNVNIYASQFEPTEDNVVINYDLDGLNKYQELQEERQMRSQMMLFARANRKTEYDGDFKIEDYEENVNSILAEGEKYSLKGKKLAADAKIKDKGNKDNNISVALNAHVLGLPPIEKPFWEKVWNKISEIATTSLKIQSGYAIFELADKLVNGFYKEYKNAAVFKMGFESGFEYNGSKANDKVKIKSKGSYGHSKQYELTSEVAIQTARKENAGFFDLAELKMVYGAISYGSLEEVKEHLEFELKGDITGLIKDSMIKRANKGTSIDKRYHDIGNPSYKSSGEPFYLGSIIFKIKPGEHFMIKGSKNGELVNLDLRDFICLRASLYVAADGKLEIKYDGNSDEKYKITTAMLIAKDDFENEAKQHDEIQIYKNIYEKKEGIKKYPLPGSYKLFINSQKEHSKTTTTEIDAKLNIGLDVGAQIDFVVLGFTPLVLDIGVNNNLLLAGNYKKNKSTYLKNGEVVENEKTVKEGEMHYKATLYGDLYYELLDYSNKPGKDKAMEDIAEKMKKQTKDLKGQVNEIYQELVGILDKANNIISSADSNLDEIDTMITCVNKIASKARSINRHFKSSKVDSAIKNLEKASKELRKIKDEIDENINSALDLNNELIAEIDKIKDVIESVVDEVDSIIDSIYKPINIFRPTVIAEIDFVNYNGVFIFDKKTQTITGYKGKKYANIVIPAKIGGVEVLNIGNGAFKEAEIKSLKFEKGSKLKSIYADAFANNNFMKFNLLELPSTVETIGSSAFASAGFKGELKIPRTLKRIERDAFRDNSITKVKLPYLENGYGIFIFNGNPIEEITFADDFKIVPFNMFASCGFGSKIKLGDSKIEEIEDGAFYNADIEGELKLPKTLKKIGTGVFDHNKISKLVLPDSLEKVGDRAFYDNKIKVLRIIGIKDGYGMTVFNNNPIEELTFAPNFKKVDVGMFGNCGFGNKINLVDSNIEEVCNGGFSSAGFTGKLKLPKTLKTLSIDAFGFNKITSVEIPSSLKEISNDAFGFNPIEKITFSDNVKVISKGMFSGSFFSSGESCNASNFEFSNKIDFENSKIERIEEDAFYDCKFEGDIRFPKTLKYIEDNAFQSSTFTTFEASTTLYLPPDCSYSDSSFGNMFEGEDKSIKIIGGVNRSPKKDDNNNADDNNKNKNGNNETIN